MADHKSFKTRIMHTTDTAENWEAQNPTLLKGEIVVQEPDETGRPKLKIGDGTSKFNDLPYFSGGEASDAVPLQNGAEGLPGESLDYARADHVHPVVDHLIVSAEEAELSGFLAVHADYLGEVPAEEYVQKNDLEGFVVAREAESEGTLTVNADTLSGYKASDFIKASDVSGGTFAIPAATQALEKALAAESASTGALSTANTAKTTAAEAKTAAQTAQTAATKAQTTADGAVTKAGTAQSTADSAVSKANAAQTTANDALNKANAAQTAINSLVRFVASGTAPDDKKVLWIDTNNKSLLKYWTGSAWQAIRASYAD